MAKNKTEDCILCFPDPCSCGGKKLPKYRKDRKVREVELPSTPTSTPAFVPPTKSDEELTQEYALTNLLGLLKPSECARIAPMLPDELTPAHHAAAWRGRRAGL